MATKLKRTRSKPDSDLRRQFEILQDDFNSIINDLTEVLSNTEISHKDISNYLLSAKIGEYFKSIVQSTMQLPFYDTYEYMSKLNTYMHFLDYKLLKGLIRKYCKEKHTALVRRMSEYEASIKLLHSSTTIAQLAYNYEWERAVPEHVKPMQVKYDKDPDTLMLEDLQALEKRLGKRLSCFLNPHLADSACPMMFHKAELYPLRITWLIPADIVVDVVNSIKDEHNRLFFAEEGISGIHLEEYYYTPGDATSNSGSNTSSPPLPTKLGGKKERSSNTSVSKPRHGKSNSSSSILIATGTNSVQRRQSDPNRHIHRIPSASASLQSLPTLNQVSVQSFSIPDQKRSEDVRTFLESNPDALFIDEETFHRCKEEIKPMLETAVLYCYLMRYRGLIKNNADRKVLTSSSLGREERYTKLMEIIRVKEEEAYMYLYMCLFESRSKFKGHADAVRVFDNYVKEKEILEMKLDAISITSEGSEASYSGASNPNYPMAELIEGLEAKFSEIKSLLKEELTKQKTDPKSIRKFVNSLPFKLRGDESSQAQNVGELDSLLGYLDSSIMSFMDYKFLEFTVGSFGSSQDLRHLMKRYAREFSNFEKRTTALELTTANWQARSEIPPSYGELTAKINTEAGDCTLERLNAIGRELCRRFLPPHSEYALLHCKFKHGSVVAEWCIAQELIPVLIEEVGEPKSASFFVENRVESLYVWNDIEVYKAPDTASLSTSSQAASIRFNDGYYHMDCNGQYPDIAMNNHHYLIQVFHKETIIGHKLRYKIGYLHEDDRIMWSSHSSIYKTGFYPRVDINERKAVVSVYASQLGRGLYYIVGYLNIEESNSEIAHSSSSVSFPTSLGTASLHEENSHYGRSSSSLDDLEPEPNRGSSSHDSEDQSTPRGSTTPQPSTPNLEPALPQITHSSPNPQLPPHLRPAQPTQPTQGSLDSANIEWKEKHEFATGRNPAVSLTNNNVVIVVFEKGPPHNLKSYYRIGDVRDNAIDWRSNSEKPLLETGNSKHVSVAANDGGQVIVGYSSGVERAVHYVAGKIDEDSIILGEQHRFTPAGVNYQPVVSINSHGHVVVVHHCLQGRLYLKISCGTWTTDDSGPKVKWSMDSGPGNFAFDGHHASVAVSDQLKVVTSFKSLTLHFSKSLRNRVGQLIMSV